LFRVFEWATAPVDRKEKDVSVTEQMVLHAQEFNVRINQIEQLAIANHQELMRFVIELMDKVEVLQIRIEEIQRK